LAATKENAHNKAMESELPAARFQIVSQPRRPSERGRYVALAKSPNQKQEDCGDRDGYIRLEEVKTSSSNC